MSEEKIYCGNAKIVNTKFGEITKGSMSKNDINTIVKYMNDNKLEWVNFEILPKKSPEQGKPTHYIKINTWKPGKSSNNDNKQENKLSDDLPF